VEKPRFLFLEGSPDAVGAADVAATALPDAPAARAGASSTRAVPSVDRLAPDASAPAPGACSSAASAALGEGGSGSHLSGGLACCCRRAPVALGSLDERLLVGTDASDLSALVGARGWGTIGAALSTRRQEFERQPFET
jgi:hypothetical protein